MNVLLIYQEIPNKADFYLIESPTEEQIRVLETACGKFVNCDELTIDEHIALDKIDEALQSNPEYHWTDYEDWKGIWADCKIELPALLPNDLHVFTCGFLM